MSFMTKNTQKRFGFYKFIAALQTTVRKKHMQYVIKKFIYHAKLLLSKAFQNHQHPCVKIKKKIMLFYWNNSRILKSVTCN